MREFYVLEYKTIDSKGREKNAQFAGIFTSADDLSKAKEILSDKNNRISFQVYNHNNIFP